MRFILLAAGVALAGSCAMHDRNPVAATCYERQFDVYFEDSETQLSPEARESIQAVKHSLTGCSIEHVRIVGLADAPGDPNENMELSQARAQTVATYLQSTTDWPHERYELVARGERNATNDAGVDRPMRRRARVTVTPHASS